MLDELRRGKNVQNRRLPTWLTEDEYRGGLHISYTGIIDAT